MKRLLPFALALFAATMFFTACGDDDSSSFVEPEKESSSSEILSSGATLSGDSHEGSSPSSCSSKDDKSSSSVSSSSTNSSSSAKSNSSTDSMSSSSSDDMFLFSSSSFPKELMCFVECTEDCEGVTYHHKDGFQMICRSGQWLNLDSMENANTSSSSYFDMTNQFNEKVSYGEFTDPRDGQKYRTVSLKDGIYYTDTLVYFAENLNFGKMIAGGTLQGDSTKYCYDDDPWYCENGWGGLYTWSNAMNLPSVCDSVSLGSEQCNYSFARDKDGKLIDGEIIHQGLCPDGWHIANDGEWANLQTKSSNSVAYYMGSKVAGFGSNNYGLSILPAGYWQLGKFDQIKLSAGFYLPQQHNSNEIAGRAVYVEKNFFERSGGASKIHALSIRCVKNY
ncbi:FISUMP domain-containing protein [Fibrobacter sp. UWH6]|uniref:FISUMP domain-containing protein n=1 Tax=Fibrobacter sp. (strain UWH6) TaxID=1896212 RepID=UPI0009200B48|nr:FISUMP domain-containing protein [Fibrobacter sp. UWH6]SHL23295.1 major paralogous domain-containing protein [Fibrobacter sp. UWH6]